MSFYLQVLGSNSAIAEPNRFSTAQILSVNHQLYLIDCAEGTQIQMRRFSIKYSKINHIFISHLHGDHFFGIFGLLSSYSLNNRKNTLNIFAPKELQKMLTSEYAPIKISELTFDVKFFNLPQDKNIIFEDNNITVECFNLKHKIETKGFIFREKEKELNILKSAIKKYNLSVPQIKNIKKGKDLKLDNKIIPNKELTKKPHNPRSFAFCSDTAYYEDIIKYIKNVDLLYHEASFCENYSEKAALHYHSTAKQAALIAKKANVKLLFIGHLSSRISNPNICLNEAKNIFKNTILANDGLIIELTKSHEFIVK